MLINSPLLLDFFNVGNADATLVRLRGAGDFPGFTMLVDCADTHDGGDERLCAALAQRGVDALDCAVITHLHADHTGALPLIAARMPVQTLWTNYLPPAGATVEGLSERAVQLLPRGIGAYLAALEALRAAGTELREIGPEGHGAQLGPGLSCRVFGPGRDVYARQRRYMDEALLGRPEISELAFFRGLLNITSLRLALDYGGSRVLLAGDLYGKFLTPPECARCTVFRAPHHGSADSITEEAIAALSPELTVVSAARGQKADRPAPETLALLKAHSGEVLLTGDAEESVHIELSPIK